MRVGELEYAAKLLDVRGVFEIDVRIAEVQLEAEVKIRIRGTTLDLRRGIVLEGIDATEATEAIGICRDLVAGPVVFRLDCRVLVRNRRLVRVGILIGHREDQGAA